MVVVVAVVVVVVVIARVVIVVVVVVVIVIVVVLVLVLVIVPVVLPVPVLVLILHAMGARASNLRKIFVRRLCWQSCRAPACPVGPTPRPPPCCLRRGICANCGR